MTEVSFGVYRPGDEYGIASLLRRCFLEFDRFGITPELWLGYPEIDRGFRRDLSFVARTEGRIVGHVQLVLREQRASGGAYIKVGGVANVCTDPGYRRRGIATALLKMAHEAARREGCAYACLFTGRGEIAHGLYRKLGYVDVRSITVFDVERVPEGGEGLRVERYEGDPWELGKIYEECTREMLGPVRRERDTWYNKFVRVFVTSFPFYTVPEMGEILVVEGTEEPEGYALIYTEGTEGHVPELFALDEAGARALLRAAISSLRARGASSVTLGATRRWPFLAEVAREVDTGGVFMSLILDPDRYLDSLCAGPPRAGLREYAGTRVELRCGGWSACLGVADDGTLFRSGEGADIRVELEREGLSLLPFTGVRPLLERSLARVSSADPEALAALDAMFPSGQFLVCPADRW